MLRIYACFLQNISHKNSKLIFVIAFELIIVHFCVSYFDIYGMETVIRETGIEIIDKHHEKLFGIIKMLKSACSEDKKKSELNLIFHKISFYTENYFQDEELLFRQHAYPNLKHHKAEHQDFINNLRAVQRRYLAGDLNACRDLTFYLERWFKRHIIDYDNDAVMFLQDKIKSSKI